MYSIWYETYVCNTYLCNMYTCVICITYVIHHITCLMSYDNYICNTSHHMSITYVIHHITCLMSYDKRHTCDVMWCVANRAMEQVDTRRGKQVTATHYNTLQHTITHCNILQHTAATHCNTLQHTLGHGASGHKVLPTQVAGELRDLRVTAVACGRKHE